MTPQRGHGVAHGSLVNTLTLRNIKLVIAYDGTAYCGWQRQKEQQTIQGVLEEKISLMTCDSASLHGAGRTDAGVHALGMVANFQTNSKIPCAGFYKGLNSLLPPDIRILAVDEAAADFHARFSARGKSYSYYLLCSPVMLPTQRLYYTHCPQSLNIDNMRDALSLLVGKHDFSSFEAVGSRDLSHEGGRGAIRTIFKSNIVKGDIEHSWIIEISGDGFLRHMVRNMVGTLLDVGRGKTTVDDFWQIFQLKDRSQAGLTAAGNGLFLQEVFY